MLAKKHLPPGPKSASLIGVAPEVQRNGYQYTLDCWKQYGDIVSARFLLTMPITVLYKPAYGRHILQDNQKNYDKNMPMIRGLQQALLGESLFTADGDAWLAQKKMLQPVFLHRNIHPLGALTVHTTQELIERRWQHFEEGQTINVYDEMMDHVLHLIARSLIASADLDQQARQEIEASSKARADALHEYIVAPFPPLSIPTPRNRRITQALQRLDRVLYRLIETYQTTSSSQADFLSLLLTLRDEHNQPLTAKHIRDQLCMFLLAGHETSAITLSWIWYLLAQHPDVEKRLHEELATVLNGRPPGLDDLPHLPYMRAVINEAMRLYPASFAITRNASHEDEIDGYHIPAGSMLSLVMYAFHRHPDYWQEPDRFLPERFLDEHVVRQQRTNFAFIPFSAGPRQCIGMNLATLQIHLVLATLAQRFQLTMAPNAIVTPKLQVTLRPLGLYMDVHAR